MRAVSVTVVVDTFELCGTRTAAGNQGVMDRSWEGNNRKRSRRR